MQNVIVAWVKDPAAFEGHVPLKFIGERNLRLNYGNDMHVVFLEGFSLLPTSYVDSLRALGYKLIDAHQIYLKFDAEFAVLNRFGDYEKKCFLRWLVMKELFVGESFIHYDGDVVLNESLEIIAKKAEGLTFVLNGCPAFTILSDSSWLTAYEMELRRFVADVEGYSAIAWREREGWEASYFSKATAGFFRNPIHSDQDLISYLIHVDRVPQALPSVVHKIFGDYILIQNPLEFNIHVPFIPLKYSRENNVDYISYQRFDDPKAGKLYKKRVLLWHMQSCFSFYLARCWLRSFIPIANLVRVNHSNKELLLDVRFNKIINRFFKHASRLSIYTKYFEQGDFSRAMNSRVWFTPGVFK
jgi:hypothetical protein